MIPIATNADSEGRCERDPEAAAVQHVAAGSPVATPEVKASRLAICRTHACGFFRVGNRYGQGGCGCYLEVKAEWADQSCPARKWGPVTGE
jgi:hypothetical protein